MHTKTVLLIPWINKYVEEILALKFYFSSKSWAESHLAADILWSFVNNLLLCSVYRMVKVDKNVMFKVLITQGSEIP